jgi:multicomponent K+:H+ antiporter subunit A
VVTTVLFLLGLRWLPKRVEESGRPRARRRAPRCAAARPGAGAGGGGGMAALSYA